MLDLSNIKDRELLENLISEDIDAFCQSYYENEHRNHLGASELGEECKRHLWYKFRWAKLDRYDGRMLRLFNVGHSAEPRFVTYLKGIGFEVREFNDDGKQFRISGAMGHYGGSLDGMCKPPARYQLSSDLVLLNEFKTNNTGSGFTKVATEHLSKSKPKHWAQMCQYGYKYQLQYGLYLIENKNDSEITIKIVELDWNYGKQLEEKAKSIIFSKEPPARISDNPAFFNCKYCHHSGICHSGEQVEKNCRSCRHATPVEDAQWHCSLHQGNIPAEFIKKGCEQWLPI